MGRVRGMQTLPAGEAPSPASAATGGSMAQLCTCELLFYTLAAQGIL